MCRNQEDKDQNFLESLTWLEKTKQKEKHKKTQKKQNQAGF